MNCICARSPSNIQDQLAAQVRFDRWRWLKKIRLIRFENVQRGAICLRVHGDRIHPEFLAGPLDT